MRAIRSVRWALAAAPVFFPWLSAAGQSVLVINELDADQIGTDAAEFVEIFNAGNDPVDFSVEPHVLVFFNGGDNTLPVIDGSYRAVQLNGVIEPGAFLVAGGTQVPHVDIIIGSGTTNLIQNGPDAVALYRGAADEWNKQRPPTTVNLIDAIVYHTDDDNDVALQSSLGVSTCYDEWNEQGSVGVVFSIARSPDGGSMTTGATPTPGRSNDTGPPLFAVAGVTLLHRNPPQPAEVLLRGEGGTGSLLFRMRSAPNHGTLADDFTAITGTGATAFPYSPNGRLTYHPSDGFTGIDTFEFDAVDDLDRVSAPAVQELAVQSGDVVITEVMHSPGTSDAPQDQRVYEFVEVFNHSANNVALVRFDSNVDPVFDTTDNLVENGQPAVIPAGAMRIIAPGGLTEDSDEAFACEWGLDESEIVRVPYDRFEAMYEGSRLLLFGEGGVLLDAVSFYPPDFWSPLPGASQSVKDSYLIFCSPQLDSAGNDCPPVWPYSGLENLKGLRLSYSGIGQGSPGYVPAGLNEDYTPLAPCEPPPLGACCLPDGACAHLSYTDCTRRDGAYADDFVPCDEAPACPQPPRGACCAPTGDCHSTDAHTCHSTGGTYEGDATPCSTVSCAPAIDVVINEIDYNQAGDDFSEYIELYGPAGKVMIGYTLALYNGDPNYLSPYREIELNLVIPSDGRYVLGSAEVPEVDEVVFTTNGIQNGSPDGVAMLDPSGSVLDAIAYGGSFRVIEGPAAGTFFHDIQVQDVEPALADPRAEVALQRIPDGIGPWYVTTDDGLGPDGTPGDINALPLPAPYGACCLSDGLCLANVDEHRCRTVEGAYRGDATSCDTPCPITIGACCLPNGECAELTQDRCEGEGGTYNGSGTLCHDVPPCLQPPPGACCLLGGGCVNEDEYDCTQVSGDYRGDWTLCGQPGAECGDPIAFRINEIYRNDDGTDDLEFIELVGPGGLDLSPFVVIEIEGDYSDTGQQGRIDNLWNLSGLLMPGDGFLVLGDDAVANVDWSLGITNQLENGTATYLLIENYDAETYPQGFDVDVDNDGLADASAQLGAILDGIAFADDGIDADAQPDSVYYDVVTLSPSGSAAIPGAARKIDALDTESPGDFCQLGLLGDGTDGLAVPTPGASNNCSTCAVLGDADGNGRIDLLDYAALQRCHTGPEGPIPGPSTLLHCRCLDLDNDDDIDLIDYAIFLVVGGFSQ